MIDIRYVELYPQTEDDKAMQVRRGLLKGISGKIIFEDIIITEECLRSMRGA